MTEQSKLPVFAEEITNALLYFRRKNITSKDLNNLLGDVASNITKHVSELSPKDAQEQLLPGVARELKASLGNRVQGQITDNDLTQHSIILAYGVANYARHAIDQQISTNNFLAYAARQRNL
mgnify:CR=1 FL=1|tara:strand:+ start:2697 stop:3062 length:366 start_codon:yes stop_codon:yes gene_type:complete